MRGEGEAHADACVEYGEFFPEELSVYGYNETKAYDYFKLTKEQALSAGYKWKDKSPRQYQPATTTPALAGASPLEIPETIIKEILACATCGKNYRIIPYELKFYRTQKISLPKTCPDCRHYERVGWQNPRFLWARACAKCTVSIQTSYAPERAETIYCQKCYLETLI